MKKFGLVLAALVFLAGCAADRSNEGLYQVSTLQALMQGNYDGETQVCELQERGDTGIGTFDALEGEMIIINGQVYQARVDGAVLTVTDNHTPFANAASIAGAESCELSFNSGFDSLKQALTDNFAGENYPWVFRIDGTFENVKFRSVPKQTKPYPPLAEAAKKQVVFHKDKACGSIVGFRFPEYFGGINVTGYHLHFISDDRSFGGHLLDIGSGQASARGKLLASLDLELGNSMLGYKHGATTAEEIEAVEQVKTTD
ncbi:MAG: acetolactate decarboxylase [Phycisphaerae bacterium]